MITKLTGFLTDVFRTETPTPNFSKRVFWLKQPDTERNPQHWQIELHQQDVREIEKYQIGDTIECEVEVRGKKWTNKSREETIFLSLRCIGLRLIKRVDPAATKALLGKFTPKKSITIDEEVPKDQQGKLL